MKIKTKINILLVAFLIVNTSLLFFLVFPAYREINESSQELVSQKQEVTFLENKIQNIEEFKENYQEIKGSLDKIENLFVNSKAPTNFISFLEESSQTSEVPIEISPSAPKQEKEDVWPAIIFRITSTCPFPSFLRFLEKIESSPYLVTIEKLNIRSEPIEEEMEGSPPIGDVDVSFSLKAFSD